jgi:hypothetical protein
MPIQLEGLLVTLLVFLGTQEAWVCGLPAAAMQPAE